MKKLLLQLSAAAAFSAAAVLANAQDEEPAPSFDPSTADPSTLGMWAIWNQTSTPLPTNGSPDSFKEGEGYLSLFDAKNYTRVESGGGFQDITDESLRVIPIAPKRDELGNIIEPPSYTQDFSGASIKVQAASVQIGGEGYEIPANYLDSDGFFNMYKFNKLFAATVRITGADTKVNFSGDINTDGNSTLIVDDGATLSLTGNGRLHGTLDMNFLGTADRRVTINAGISEVNNGKTTRAEYTDWVDKTTFFNIYGAFEFVNGSGDTVAREAGKLVLDHTNFTKLNSWIYNYGDFTVTDSTIKMGQITISDDPSGTGQVATSTGGGIRVGGNFNRDGGDRIATTAQMTVTNSDIIIGDTKTYVDKNGVTQTARVGNGLSIKGGGTFTMSGALDGEGNPLNNLILHTNNIELGGKMNVSNLNIELKNGGIKILPAVLSGNTENFEDAVMTIGDNVNATFSGNIDLMPVYERSGFTANSTIRFVGENSHFKVGGDLCSSYYGRNEDSGNSVIIIGGKNNSIYTAKNTNLDGYNVFVDDGRGIYSGEVGIVVEGEGNTYSSDSRIYIGRNSGHGYVYNGKAYFHVSSTNADNVSKLLLGHNTNRDENGNIISYTNNAGINLGFSDANVDYGDSYISELVFGGNTLVRDMEGDGRIGSISVGTELQQISGDEAWQERQSQGDARMIVKGENNDIWTHDINIANVSNLYGGTATVDITGSNNKLRMEGSISIVSSWYIHGGEGRFSLSGDNNVIDTGYIYVASGRSAQTDGVWKYADGGKGYFSVTGSNNTINVRSSLNISGNSNLGGGEGYVDFEGRNNAITINGVTSVGNHDNSVGNPIGVLTLGGKGNTYNFNGELKFGGGGANYAGYGKIIVKGGGNTINVNGSLRTWAPGDASLDDMRGGILAFQFDTDGISAINITGADTYFGWGGSFLEIDFTGLVGAQDTSWTIITSAANKNFAAWNIDQNFLDNKVNWITRDESDQYSLVKEQLEDGSWALKVYYTSTVPEPAAFAAVFGLAALLFAARRRGASSRN